MTLPTTPMAEVTRRLWVVEQELELFRRRAGGVAYWERVRFAVGQHLLAALVYGEPAQERSNGGWRERLRNAPPIARSVVLQHPFLHAPVDTVFVGHPRRKLGSDGRWWDLYCDPIAREIQGTSLLVERPYASRHSQPTATPSIAHLDAVTLASRIRGWWKPFRMSGADRRELEQVDAHLFDEFGISVGLVSVVVRELEHREQQLPIFRDLLARLSPSCVVTTVSYANREVTEAARDLGIPVVEVQHGTVSPFHLAYGYPELPGSSSAARTESFPDRFLTFGAAFHAMLYAIPARDVIAVGSAYHEEERQRHPPAEDRRSVLFLSQRPSGATLTRWAVDLAAAVDGERSVIVKLHPAERSDWRSRYPWLVSSSVTVVEDDEPSLYALFAKSCAQVGVNSTALYEGMTYPLRTFLAELPGVEHMEPATGLGLDIVIASDVATIAEQMRDPPEEPPGDAVAALFSPNAIHSTCATIEASRRPRR